ncbi:hypothetical protein L6R52_00895 [Myxococcota bacterium]|nr:hypothetical protein [Myxococcota bacterium]
MTPPRPALPPSLLAALAIPTLALPSLVIPSRAHAADPSPLERAIADVLPSADEDRWMSVPWRTDVVAALDEAARVKKPVFFWVMNGNPLGCA